MKRLYLNDIEEKILNKVRKSLPKWLSIHTDYDNEISLIVESFGKRDKTPICNPLCKYCYTTQIPEIIKRKLINFTKDLYPHDILNNPFLKEDILEAKEYAKKFNLPLRVSTSGKGLTKDIAKFLIENVDILEITLNSPVPETRAIMMNISLNQAKKEIEIIKSLEKTNKVYLSSIISHDNFEDVDSILDFGRNFPKNILIPIGVTKWSKLKPLSKQQRVKIIEMAKKYQNVVLAGTFFSELKEYLDIFLDGIDLSKKPRKKNLIVTTESFSFVIEKITKKLGQCILIVKNSMGGNINSAGLLLGQDLIKSLKEFDNEKLKNINYIIVPYISLINDRFIDGYSLEDLRKRFNKNFIKGPKDYTKLPQFLLKLDEN